MKTFRVRVWSGTMEYRTVVRARNQDEAFEEALRVLKLSHKNVKRMEAVEVVNGNDV
jgi:hypothetical protein